MVEATKITQLPLASIRTDGGTQPRAALDQNVIEEYAQDMLLDAVFPPVIVFYDGSDYWLADGFHRYHGAKQICRESIDAEIKQGTRRDAVLYSVGTNAAHGLRRTNADKRRAVETLLKDEEWSKWSGEEIARRSGVSAMFVSNMRKELSLNRLEIERKVERNGTIYTMNTVNIGQQQNLTSQEFVDEVFPGFSRWQSDNQDLGLDEFADPLPTVEKEDTPIASIHPLERPLYETFVRATTPAPTIPESWKLPPEMRGTPTEPLLDAREKRDAHVMRIMGSSESPEWYTPQDIIDLVCKLFGTIDTDPCSNSHDEPNVPARTIYTKADDGLSHPWSGKTYMNPPYGTEIAGWVEKLIHEHKHGEVTEAIALLPGRIDTQWFQPLYEYYFCHIRGRLQFSNAQYSAPFPSVIAYLGPNINLFIDTFKDCYARGRVGEGLCARWLMHREGWTILPAYEIEIPSGKGPRLFTLDGKLIAPDIFAMKHQKRRFLCKWFEAKHKTRFTWHRISGNWQTGIDIKHYLDYIKVQEQTKIEVFALFLHNCSEPSKGDLEHGSPRTCPTGLYGRPLRYLMEHEHHRDAYDRGNRSYPMVYWNETDLEKLATLEEVKVLPISLWEGGAA